MCGFVPIHMQTPAVACLRVKALDLLKASDCGGQVSYLIISTFKLTQFGSFHIVAIGWISYTKMISYTNYTK